MSMSQVIQVEKVNKYSSDLIYPRNALAERLARYGGRKPSRYAISGRSKIWALL